MMLKGRGAIQALAVLVIAAIAFGLWGWNTAFRPNSLEAEGRFVLAPGTSMDSAIVQLDQEGRILSAGSFGRYLRWRGWDDGGGLRPGRYMIPEGLDNRALARLLRSGAREAVRVRFNSARLPEDVAEAVSDQMALEQTDILAAMKDPLTAARNGTDVEAFRTRFIPNTYEVWYDMSAPDFVDRLVREWKIWWSLERRAKAEALGLTPEEAGILASIVKSETSQMDEAPTVAGLYLNRLRRGMRLQADPTLIYALGDFSIRRVLNVHRKIDSPYNTYKYSGLPPGPINYPEPAYLEAVLNAEEHGYIFMCAREDFSGFHAFAKTNREHEKNARRYRKALDKQGVYK
ncbi:MAG: endolytic transglycosylase MltG [Flavobacteriales bacterium]|nr:endolytic transglycosylase MltG [Flavobacteriales bacterium]